MMRHSMGLARIGLVLALVSCGGGGDSGSGDDTAGGEDFEESGSMRALQEGEEAPPMPSPPIGEDSAVAGDMSQLQLRPAEAPPANTRALYRQLAPATVIVRSTSTMGTGVIVGPNGLILTNNHVIQHAEHRDFRMRVTVEYGDFGDAGSMIPDGEHRTAWVVKRDEDRDLALLQVEEPPEGRPIVSMSANDPSPGGEVITLGHGNTGMVWAVRRCEVEATGRLEETYSRLQAICGSEDQRAAQMCEQLREQMHSDMEGVVVQTSCPLAPGDSGGPLVDGNGNLVGLNVMTIRNMQAQHSNFHIHVRELRDFLSHVPDHPIIDVPTPFIDHQLITQMDQDLDGRWDTVVMRARGAFSTLVDLDQDSPDTAPDALEQRVQDHGFDAEVAIVTRFPHRFIWYDTNADGELDLIFTLDAQQRVEAAHTVRGNDIAEAQVPPGPGISASRVPASMRERFERIFHAHATDHPDPMPALLRRGQVSDSDHDGTMDTIHGQRMLVHAVAFDVDQDSVANLTDEGVDAFVAAGNLDAEMTMIYREPTLYMYYDRDNDGSFDTGVRAAPNSSVVAAVIEMEGATAPSAEDLIGTLAIRGDWLGERADAVRAMALPHVVDSWVATAEDPIALPDPVHHHPNLRVQASYREDGWENHVLRAEDDGYISSLVDVDRNAWRGRNRQYRDDLTAAVREGHFSAEFAVISTRSAFWAWYDRDYDGEWDLCLVQVNEQPEPLFNAFARQSDDSWARDESMVEGRPIRPALIRRRDRQRFDTLVRAYFAERYITPAEQ